MQTKFFMQNLYQKLLTFDTKRPIFNSYVRQVFLCLNAMSDSAAYILIVKLPTRQKWRQFGIRGYFNEMIQSKATSARILLITANFLTQDILRVIKQIIILIY